VYYASLHSHNILQTVLKRIQYISHLFAFEILSKILRKKASKTPASINGT